MWCQLFVLLVAAFFVQAEEDIYKACEDKQMFCYGMGAGENYQDCIKTKNCLALLRTSYDNNTEVLSLELHSGLTDKDHYVAAGFGIEDGMNGIVGGCYVRGDKAVLAYSFNVYPDNHPIDDQSLVKGFVNGTASFNNGKLRCTWQVEPSGLVAYDKEHFSVTFNQTFLKLAQGPTKDGHLDQHDHAISLKAPVNLHSFGKTETSPNGDDHKGKDHDDHGHATDIYQACVHNQMFCYGLPSDCIASQKCDVLLRSSYDNDTDILSLELHSSTIDKDHYVAAGFDAGGKMSGIVAGCYTWKDQTVLKYSFNIYGGANNEPIEDQSLVKGFTNGKASYADGRLHCTWQVEPSGVVTYKDHIFPLGANKTFIKLAKGPVSDGNLVRHKHTDRSVTLSAIDLRAKGIAQSAGTSNLLKWHASLMITGWLGCVTVAIIMARYGRDQYRDTTLFNLKVWFVVHRVLMALAWCLIIAAYICILIYTKKFQVDSFHSVAGFVAIILATLQIGNSFLRPAPDAKHRWVFDYVHWFMGSSAHFLAVVNILRASQERGAPAFFWVTISYVFIYFFFTDILRKVHLKVWARLKDLEVGYDTQARLYEILTILVILIIFGITITLVYLMFKFG